MSDLISRQVALDAIDTLLIQLHKRHTNGVKGSFEDGVQDGYCRIRNSIKWMPSAEKTGEWVEKGTNEDGTHNIVCSLCGSGYKTRGHANSYNTRMRFKFCPSCGAKMKGEEQ